MCISGVGHQSMQMGERKDAGVWSGVNSLCTLDNGAAGLQNC